jgi:hypothetical protein
VLKFSCLGPVASGAVNAAKGEANVQITDGRRVRQVREVTAILLCSLFVLIHICLVAPRVNAFASQSSAQSREKPPDLKAFVGTWTASFKGEVFATLVLRQDRDGALAGTLNNFDLVVDKDGNLLDGTHQNQGDAALLNPHFKSGTLVFVVMQKDQYYPSTAFAFIPRTAYAGELTPSANNPPYANSNSTVKPIPMVRERPKP